MRFAAAVIDTQRINGPYPGPTTGLVPLASVIDKCSAGARLPRGTTRDAWGRPIYYWSNGNDYSTTTHPSPTRTFPRVGPESTPRMI